MFVLLLNVDFFTFTISPSQILQKFTLKSMNVGEVGMKVELIPVPDQRISIDFEELWILFKF